MTAPDLLLTRPVLTLLAGGSGPTRPHDIAGCVVRTDVDEPWLRPFVLPGSTPEAGPPEAGVPRTFGKAVYDGPGLVGGVVRRVVRQPTEAGCVLYVEGVGSTVVDFALGVARRLEACGAGPSPVEVEVLFGPALVLLLASRGVFCLHAGSVRRGREAVAFLGPSGAGKSTLARAAPRAGGWERIGDDLLPVVLSGSGADALPRFPQLKLPEEAQWGLGRQGRIPLRAAYEVRTRPPAKDVEVAVTATDGREGLLRLLRFTVAARLFDRTMTERHLAFCDSLAGRVRVGEFSYPRSFEALPAVYAALEMEEDRPPRANAATDHAGRFAG